MENIRTRTLSITFSAKKTSLEDLAKFVRFLGFTLTDIEVLQEEYGGRMVHVKFREGKNAEERIEEILRTPRRQFKDSDGLIQDLFMTKNGVTIDFVKIRNLPPEAGLSALRQELSEYGSCLDVSWDRFQHGPFKGVRNGTRIATMSLVSHVPSYIRVLGYEGVVEYAGQPKTCRVCDSQEHLRANCPERYATGTEEAADAAPADAEAAGGEEEEEGEGEVVPVPRAASEPPPTTTSADVTDPAADAPPGPSPPAACDATDHAAPKHAESWRKIAEMARERSRSRKREASDSPENEGGGVKTRGSRRKKK